MRKRASGILRTSAILKKVIKLSVEPSLSLENNCCIVLIFLGNKYPNQYKKKIAFMPHFYSLFLIDKTDE